MMTSERKRASMPGVGGSGAVKQGTFLSNAFISSQIGELIGVSFSLISSLEVWPTRIPSSTGQAFFSAEEFTTNSCPYLTVSKGGTCVVGASETGSS